MIEKKSELLSDLTASREMSFDMKEFLKQLNKKNKDKTISHGVDMNAGILSFYSELYSKKKPSTGKATPECIGKNVQQRVGEVISELADKVNKSQISHVMVPEINEHIKLADTSLTAKHINTLDKSGSKLLDVAAHCDDAETKEQLNGTIKAHQILVQQTQDMSLLHTDPPRPVAGMRSAQPTIAERLFQANANAKIDNTTVIKQTLNLDYPFLRWSGEHSVKVRISVDAKRTGNLTLLPSDSRAAEMLTRKIGYLDGYTAEVLYPQHDDDESEQPSLSQRWEDELE